MTNHVALWVENCSGAKIADGRMSMPTSVSALAGFCRYTRSKYRPTNGKNGSAAMPDRLRITPRSSRLDVLIVSFR